MSNYTRYINALRACAKEHKDDFTPFAHIRVSDLCSDTADLLERLEQESVLDKIRAEIDQYLFQNEFGSEYRKEVSQIIDKYKAESEVE